MGTCERRCINRGQQEMGIDDSSWIVGVDAGGSKTVAWLGQCTPGPSGDMRIRLQARGTSGPGNPSSRGIDAAADSIKNAIDSAICDSATTNESREFASITPKFIWIGAAGAARADVSHDLRQIIANHYPSAHVRVSGDVSLLIAAAQASGSSSETPDWIMRSNTPNGLSPAKTTQEQFRPAFVTGTELAVKIDRKRPVVAIIAGTGSIVWANDGNSHENRWGGLGPAIGDVGSGCWLGQQAIQATMDELDGRGPKTELVTMLTDHFRILNHRELTDVLRHRNHSPDDLAKLAPMVIDAARRDPVAASIVQSGLKGLAELARLAADWLGNSHSIVWALGGGVLTENPGMADQLLDLVNEDIRRAERVTPTPATLVIHQPVWGALVAAAFELESQRMRR
ncbi:MAG: BadF/BadG/BcrA/BcrD ATPase family protein [Pirellulaceae bacterium]|nr:BadF/BadG/BcrA/BcrD ATPase family protein [Pirellulaceae bacterium]